LFELVLMEVVLRSRRNKKRLAFRISTLPLMWGLLDRSPQDVKLDRNNELQALLFRECVQVPESRSECDFSGALNALGGGHELDQRASSPISNDDHLSP
jgi:hypothetical protein